MLALLAFWDWLKISPFIVLDFIIFYAFPIWILSIYFRRSTKTQIAIAAGVGLTILLLTWLVTQFEIDFVDRSMNLYWMLLCQLAYYFAAASCLQIPRTLPRSVTLAVLVLPVIALAVSFPISLLGWPFFGPGKIIDSKDLSPTLSCRTNLWGGFGNDEGYESDLFRTWALVPFLHKRIAWISVDENNDGVTRSYTGTFLPLTPTEDSCARMLTEVSIKE